MNFRFLLSVATVAVLSAFASEGPMMAPHSQANLPAAVKVPGGNRVVMKTSTLGGKITCQCRAKKDISDQFEWVFAGPPATWESVGGSKITGTQVAVAPNGDGNIPN